MLYLNAKTKLPIYKHLLKNDPDEGTSVSYAKGNCTSKIKANFN